LTHRGNFRRLDFE